MRLYPGGSQSLVLNLYKVIDRSKIQFDFIIDEPDQLFHKQTVENLGGKVYVLPKFNGKNYFAVKKAWKTFFIEHPEYKILHSHVRSYASLYIPIAKKFGLKTIIHSHSTSTGGGLSGCVKAVFQYPLRYQADYLMACSSKAGEWLYGKKACKKDNYVYMPNAINFDEFKFNSEIRQKYRSELGLEDKFVIGHVGSFLPVKNHKFLLEVINETLKLRENAVLLLVGDGILHDQITNQVKSLGLTDKVIFLGRRSDVGNILQSVDIFVLPSLWEGLPMTAIEAQVSGLKCLISDTITEEVCVSKLVNRLDINDINVWVKELSTSNGERLDVLTDVSKHGFDMKESSRKYADFYLKLAGEI